MSNATSSLRKETSPRLASTILVSVHHSIPISHILSHFRLDKRDRDDTNLSFATDDMELDDYDESWQEMPIFPYEIQDNEFCRTETRAALSTPAVTRREPVARSITGA